MPTFQIAFTQMCGQAKAKNEDALCANHECYTMKNLKTRWVDNASLPIRLAVADGVHQSPQPHLASQFWIKRWAQSGECQAMFFQAAFDDFCANVPFGSSTTFVGLTMDEMGRYAVANLGDSRAYHISADGKWTQISYDHSLINEMIKNGEAQAGVEYSGIYQALEHCLIADSMEDTFTQHIHYHRGEIGSGEAILLCSDGLYDALSHETLERIWQSQNDLATRLHQLKMAVKRTHYYDDCSIVCVQAS